MLGKRLLTAMVGIPIAIFIINYDQWLFALTISFLTFVAWFEYTKMLQHKHLKPDFAVGALGIAFILGCAWFGNPTETTAVTVMMLFVALIKTVISFGKFSFADAAFTFLGLFYIGFLFSHLLLLRFLDQAVLMPTGTLSAGAVYLWIAFLGTWASDTFAYLVGSKIGRTKLAPLISPGKTREGAVGGLIGTIVTVAIFGSLFQLPLQHLLVLGLLVGIVAPLGDLVQSVIKRYVGVKDSGNFFPGHGGVLDRFDSILFTVPAVYYYIQIFLLR